MYKVYGANNCPACVNTKALLENQNIKYMFVDVSKDTALLMPAGHKTIPVVYDTAGKLIGGYNDLLVHLSTR